MPRLKRLSAAPSESALDVIWTLVIGVGLEHVPARRWPKYRAEAWKLNLRRHHFPLAAAVFDGFTDRCFRELARPEDTFDFHRFEAALVEDRAALQAFREGNPKAAATLKPWLDELVQDMDMAHAEASARADGRSWSVPGRERAYEENHDVRD
jgi:hypothetical protein